MERTILHCDMNNFYASVECMLNPSLRGHPVAVGGDVENRHGIILAKNYEAKKFGIQTGEALWQAKQKCPKLIIVPPHYEEYLKYSRLAHSIYADYTDLIEPYGMDEVWMDVTGSTKAFGSGEVIANTLRERIKYELGLTISVGVSFCKVFAKLGSDMKKPDAVTVIPKDSFRDIIWNLPASDMLGVGRSTEKFLSSYGIHTIGQLANAYPDLMQRKLGKNGMVLLAFANGEDRSKVAPQDYEPPMKSIGHGITTMQDLENNAEVWNIMLALTQDIGHKLRVYNKNAAGVAIYIRYIVDKQIAGKQWQCQLPVRTHSAAIIAKEAYRLFERSYGWEYPIRSVTVRAINLCSQDLPEQLQFFSDAATVERKEKLETAVEDIRRRFGKYSIQPACLCQNIKMPTDREVELRMPTGMFQ
ncbi:MAG: DNA polymerase IV [Ruminococcaceae bacterium]|nr:DNA polymerase IV [Oscillospiraceae bacterium]